MGRFWRFWGHEMPKGRTAPQEMGFNLAMCHQSAVSPHLCPTEPAIQVTGQSLRRGFSFLLIRGWAQITFPHPDKCQCAKEEGLSLFPGPGDILHFLMLPGLNI